MVFLPSKLVDYLKEEQKTLLVEWNKVKTGFWDNTISADAATHGPSLRRTTKITNKLWFSSFPLSQTLSSAWNKEKGVTGSTAPLSAGDATLQI